MALVGLAILIWAPTPTRGTASPPRSRPCSSSPRPRRCGGGERRPCLADRGVCRLRGEHRRRVPRWASPNTPRSSRSTRSSRSRACAAAWGAAGLLAVDRGGLRDRRSRSDRCRARSSGSPSPRRSPRCWAMPREPAASSARPTAPPVEPVSRRPCDDRLVLEERARLGARAARLARAHGERHGDAGRCRPPRVRRAARVRAPGARASRERRASRARRARRRATSAAPRRRRASGPAGARNPRGARRTLRSHPCDWPRGRPPGRRGGSLAHGGARRRIASSKRRSRTRRATAHPAPSKLPSHVEAETLSSQSTTRARASRRTAAAAVS